MQLKRKTSIFSISNFENTFERSKIFIIDGETKNAVESGDEFHEKYASSSDITNSIVSSPHIKRNNLVSKGAGAS